MRMRLKMSLLCALDMLDVGDSFCAFDIFGGTGDSLDSDKAALGKFGGDLRFKG